MGRGQLLHTFQLSHCSPQQMLCVYFFLHQKDSFCLPSKPSKNPQNRLKSDVTKHHPIQLIFIGPAHTTAES